MEGVIDGILCVLLGIPFYITIAILTSLALYKSGRGTGIFTLLGLSLVYRMGTVPEAFATIIFALPPVARLTALSIRQVPKNVVVAAMISAGDLGEVVLKGIIQMKIGLGFEGGLPS